MRSPATQRHSENCVSGDTNVWAGTLCGVDVSARVWLHQISRTCDLTRSTRYSARLHWMAGRKPTCEVFRLWREKAVG